MKTIRLGELQKNISIFNKLNDVIQIIDKRQKKLLATIYPNKTLTTTKELAGKYKKYYNNENLDEIKSIAFTEALKEKYDISD